MAVSIRILRQAGNYIARSRIRYAVVNKGLAGVFCNLRSGQTRDADAADFFTASAKNPDQRGVSLRDSSDQFVIFAAIDSAVTGKQNFSVIAAQFDKNYAGKLQIAEVPDKRRQVNERSAQILMNRFSVHNL